MLSRSSYEQETSSTFGLLEIEVKAMEIGVSFAWDVGIRDVVVESDSKIVADTL